MGNADVETVPVSIHTLEPRHIASIPPSASVATIEIAQASIADDDTAVTLLASIVNTAYTVHIETEDGCNTEY